MIAIIGPESLDAYSAVSGYPKPPVRVILGTTPHNVDVLMLSGGLRPPRAAAETVCAPARLSWHEGGSMSLGWFDMPLMVLMPLGGTKDIRTATQAVEYLTSGWPIEGQAAQYARDICLAVLKDLLHPKLGRRAFEVALRQANRMVPV